MSNPIRWFINLNKKCSKAIAKIFPNTKCDMGACYHEQITKSLADNYTVLDVGGGRKCQFQEDRLKFKNVHVIALDPSEDELNYNNDVEEKIVFAMGTDQPSPLKDSSIDVVVSHMVLEHIRNNDLTMREVNRILKPGGTFISVMPSKFALFAMINRMLPSWLTNKVLFFFMPEEKGVKGFKAYYDRIYYPAIDKLLTRHGFSSTEYFFSYHQSEYFEAFVPCEIVSLLWDFLMYLFGVKPLCAYICFTAHKDA